MARSLFAALLFSCIPGPSLADEASEAQLQYELGAEMYRQRKYPEALERFLASNRLVPNANVAFNIAQTYQLMRRPVDAYNWYEEHLSFPVDEASRREGVLARDRLAPRLALVDVATDPPGAQIFVDRTELGAIGRTPRRVAVIPGEHAMVFRLVGWRETSSRVTARQGQVEPLAVTLERIMGTVEVQSTPAGAAVRLEGQDEVLGTTPARLSLPVGRTRLILSLAGHVEQAREVVLEDGVTARVSAPLVRAAATVATLTVRARPRGALVLLDGRRLGEAPLTRTGLDPGAARLEVRARGHEPFRTEIVLEAGAATRVRARLIDPDDRAWRGWWWLGMGGGAALLAGGLVMGALALQAHADLDTNPTRESYDELGTLNIAADVLAGAGLLVAAATLVVDLLSGPPPASHGEVSLDR